MKNRALLYSAFLLLPLLAGCGDEYSLEKFSVSHEASYQLWDNFDYGNLKVVYDETELEKNQYDVDFSEFDAGKVGESKIAVSLRKSPKISVALPIQITHRASCNLLCVGSSLVGEAISYANELLKNTDGASGVHVYAAVSDEASLDDLYASFARGDASYSFLSYDSETSSWTESEGKTLKEILSGEISFDAVCLSEENAKAGKKESFSNLSRFALSLSSFYASLGKNAPSLGYLMPWSYEDKAAVDPSYYEDYGNDGNVMYQAIADVCRENVASSGHFNFVLPVGTAIQNARENGFITLKDFTADGKSLDLTYGRYLASLCLVAKLTGHGASYFSYRGESGSELLTEEEKSLFDGFVDAAVSNPYQVTKEEKQDSESQE